MPISAPNSSSSQDPVALSDHLDESSHQNTSLIKAYNQDMFLRHIASVGRVVVVPPHAGRHDVIREYVWLNSPDPIILIPVVY
jgi:hypothetical protein